LNFIRDAPMGGHLLYPGQAGKTISLIGKAEVNGRSTYHLRIELPKGQVIQSFLDTETYAEVRQILINNVTGETEITDLFDFRRVGPLRVAFEQLQTIDGERAQRIKISEAKINPGVMTWMFERPEKTKDTTEAAQNMPALLAPGAHQDDPDPFARALNESIAESSTFSLDRPIPGSAPRTAPGPPSFGPPNQAQDASTSFFTEPSAPALSK